jgi:AraC-like DNA-binding protein
VTDQGTTGLSTTAVWITTNGVDDCASLCRQGFAALCCPEPHIDLLSDPETFSLTQRVGGIGPLAIAELVVDSDVEIDCGNLCGAYRVNVLRSGAIESVHRGAPFVGGPGAAAVYRPEGETASRWDAGSRLLGVKIDRCVVEDALSRELGMQLTSQIDFRPHVSTEYGAARSWIGMLSLFAEQLFRKDSVLDHPAVGLPFVDSLVHGLLMAVDHSHRGVLAGEAPALAPRNVRTAVEIIEEEAHLPLTVSSIASRSFVSVRSLQEGFRHHLGTSPMAYLRAVRLRRAHQTLLESDPSTVSVSAVAHRWGFGNLGRFAAAHIARYGEPPAVTLRRMAFHQTGKRSHSAAAR